MAVAHLPPGITVRPARAGDAAELAELLNAIILAGGTTALETCFDPPGFADAFLTGPRVLACSVAEAEGGLAGFQVLLHDPALPPGWGDIGSFARQVPRRRGVGSALFPATRTAALRLGLVAINATIRADNSGGLAYYTGLGFADYRVIRAVPLADGRPVDRICKRLLLRDDGAVPDHQ